MLNFRTTTIALLIFAALVLILFFFNIRLGMFPILAIIVWLILLVTGSVNICQGFYIKAFCKGKTSKKLITLTFDDGPDAKNTPLVLEILDKHHIPATFFLIGNKAEKQVELVRLIFSRGHLIGLHSYSHHFFFDFFSRKKMEQDLLKAEGIIMEATGKKPLLFRPPYGVTNPVLAKVVKKMGYKVIGWSVRSFDTIKKDEDGIVERIKRGLHPGAVILMHDDREITAKLLEKVILMIMEEGYRFVGLEEVLGIDNMVK